MKWKVLMVSVETLEETLTSLEQSHPMASPPVIVYIDITRVLVAWRYQESNGV